MNFFRVEFLKGYKSSNWTNSVQFPLELRLQKCLLVTPWSMASSCYGLPKFCGPNRFWRLGLGDPWRLLDSRRIISVNAVLNVEVEFGLTSLEDRWHSFGMSEKVQRQLNRERKYRPTTVAIVSFLPVFWLFIISLAGFTFIERTILEVNLHDKPTYYRELYGPPHSSSRRVIRQIRNPLTCYAASLHGSRHSRMYGYC